MSITSKTKLFTEYGELNIAYHESNNDFCVTLSKGDFKNDPIVRIQSSCLFSEAFHSIDCDCNLQLSNSIKLITENGNGVVVYLYQEGRGHGLDKKIKAMEVMNTLGYDTAQAFDCLKYELDPRNYQTAIEALKDLKISGKIKLISNNPRKVEALEKAGFELERIKLTYPVNSKTRDYLKSKKEKLGHKIDWIDKIHD
jgi:GTP cyclohydrolase II